MGDAEQQHHFQAHHSFQSHDPSKLFSESIVALPFSQYCREEAVWNLDGSRPALGVQKSISLSCRIRSGLFIHFSDPDGAVTLTILPSTFPIATTLLMDCPYSLQKRNDHVWSFCRYTRFCTWRGPSMCGTQDASN